MSLVRDDGAAPLTPLGAAMAISDASLAAVRAHPGFHNACQRMSAGDAAAYRALDPRYRWITHDVGRFMICVNGLLLDYGQLGLTVQSLTVACRDIASPGRVSQVVRRLLDMGGMTMAPSDEPWRRQPLVASPDLFAVVRARSRIDLQAALSLCPDEAHLLRILDTDAGVANYALAVGLQVAARPELFANAPRTAFDYFLEREGGALLLFELLGRQAEPRQRLLEEAPVARQELARACDISRAQVARLLTDGGETELGRDTVRFSAALSDAVEQHFALVFHLDIGAVRAIGSGWSWTPDAAPTDG